MHDDATKLPVNNSEDVKYEQLRNAPPLPTRRLNHDQNGYQLRSVQPISLEQPLSTKGDETFLDLNTTADTGNPEASRRSRDPADWIDFNGIKSLKRRTLLPSILERHSENEHEVLHTHSSDRANIRGRTDSMDTSNISWTNTPSTEIGGHRRARKLSKNGGPTRIKSIGSAPIRSTPALTTGGNMRGSLHLEPIMIPSHHSHNTEIIQESFDSVNGQSALNDLDYVYTQRMEEKGYF